METLLFRTKDHPEANGRIAQQGEVCFLLDFPLEDGNRLIIATGLQVIADLRKMLSECDTDMFVASILNYEPT